MTYELAESLVHLTERLSVPKPVTDPHFNVVVQAAKLKRVVEMYQWVETEHSRDVTDENGATTTEYSYDYTQVNVDDLIGLSDVIVIEIVSHRNCIGRNGAPR